jgi:preprotein translocase subunit SecA
MGSTGGALNGIRGFLGIEESALSAARAALGEIDRLWRGFVPLDCMSLAARSAALARLPFGEDRLRAALALFKEASFRTNGHALRDEQIAAAHIMAHGGLAEMRTGEGKTLAGAAASYALALGGGGLHVVTSNSYLAGRDHSAIAPTLSRLGLTSAVVHPGMDDTARRRAYLADITYGANSTFVFDHLRDSLALSDDATVMRELRKALVDEADAVLLDEATTPLVLSTASRPGPGLSAVMDRLVAGLERGLHYETDDGGGVSLTEAGTDLCERVCHQVGALPPRAGLYDGGHEALHRLTAALAARYRLRKDIDYVVKDGAVAIVDANTGRILEGRRYGDGVHEALETKEALPVSGDGAELTSISYMNYFGLYGFLCGMSGTAAPSSVEIERVYGLRVTRVPTRLPVRRHDDADLCFETAEARDAGVVDAILRCHAIGRPVLVGTRDIPSAERIAAALASRGFERGRTGASCYRVLNALDDGAEAEVVASAGAPHAITIATNMAGRGTDIPLGGPGRDQEARRRVIEAGGLMVIGTERHESRRIDDQLRGRAGRQGDPGGSRFFVSLEDHLLARHSPLPPAERATAHPNALFDQAQRIAEAASAEARDALRQFDRIDMVQRAAFRGYRREVAASPLESAFALRRSAAARAVGDITTQNGYAEEWDLLALEARLRDIAGHCPPLVSLSREDGFDRARVETEVCAMLEEIESRDVAGGVSGDTARSIMLSAFDGEWRLHREKLEILRRVVGFRTYALLQPLVEYRVEAYPLFSDLIDAVEDECARRFSWRERPL